VILKIRIDSPKATRRRGIPPPPTSQAVNTPSRSHHLSTRVWSAGKLLLLTGALLATYLVFAFVAMRIALKTSEVRVPDLTARDVNAASSVLADLGLTLKVDDSRRLDPKIGADRIAQQEPAMGTTVRRQRSIRVWLSAGPNASTVPRLVGQPERSADLRLSQDGIAVSGRAEIRSSDYAEGAVIAQEPPPDSRATSVTLLVNRGERTGGYVMPDLIGVNGDRAADLLRSRGFRVAVVSEHPYPGVPAGVVLRQSPQGGFQISAGDAISLEVSQ
jgi:eukaryotic-like serine/threonine-protein kinase